MPHVNFLKSLNWLYKTLHPKSEVKKTELTGILKTYPM